MITREPTKRKTCIVLSELVQRFGHHQTRVHISRQTNLLSRNRFGENLLLMSHIRTEKSARCLSKPAASQLLSTGFHASVLHCRAVLGYKLFTHQLLTFGVVGLPQTGQDDSPIGLSHSQQTLRLLFGIPGHTFHIRGVRVDGQQSGRRLLG